MADSTVTENAIEGKGDAAAPRRTRPTSSQPSTLNKVIEALRECNDNPRKGTSVQAIKTWIDANYIDTKSTQKGLLKKALESGMGQRLIERPKKDDEGKPTLVGRYRLGKPPKPAPKRVKKADPKAKVVKKAKGEGDAHRGRSTSPKTKKGRPVPRARARSVSATPRVSKSKKIRSRLSKSHSPVRTPKVIKPKAKTTEAGGRKKTATSPAMAKAVKGKKALGPAKKSAKKSPVAKASATVKATTKKTAKPAKPTKSAGKTVAKDGGKKKK